MMFPMILAGVAFAGAIALIAGLFASLKVTEARGGRGFLSLFPPIVLTLAALSAITIERDVGAIVDLHYVSPPASPAVVWFGRFASLAILVIAVERIASYAASRAGGGRRDRRAPLPLMIAFVVFWVTTVLLPSTMGAVPQLSQQMLYTVLAGCAALTAGDDEALRSVAVARDATLLVLIASLLAVPVLPVWQTIDLHYAEGLIPGLPRLHGIATHAVMLGLVALVAALLLAARPFRSRALNAVAWLLSAAVLLLAQSKISWLSAIVCGAAMALVRWGPSVPGWITVRRNAAAVVAALVLITVAFFGVAGVLSFGAVGAEVDAFLASDQGDNLATLTNRDLIWNIALQEWARHPLFGYGPTLFDEAYRMSVAVPSAVHAHSQVVDVLARSGVVGAAGLAVYLVALTHYAFRYTVDSRGLTLALYLLLVLRAVTETPLALFELSTDTIVHFMLLMVVAGCHARAASASRPLVSRRAPVAALYPQS